MKKLSITLTAALFAAFPVAHSLAASHGAHPGHHAQAGKRAPGVNHRQVHQRQRIHHGAHSGQLTKEEVKTLAQEQKAIRAQERAYKADGTLTQDERKDLHQDLNQASKNIYNEKHDAETR